MPTAIPINRDGTKQEALPTGGPVAHTTTALALGVPWTSGWLDVAAWGTVRVQAMVAAFGGTIVLDWSLDGAVVSIAGVPAAVLPGVLYNPGAVAVAAQYVRLTYTQGAGASGAINIELLVAGVGSGGSGVLPPTNVDVQGNIWSKNEPDPSSIEGALADFPLQGEPDGALKTRARVLTDETAFSEDYPNAAGPVAVPVALAGTSLFTAGLTAVVGTGTFYTTAVRVGDYVELDADFSAAAPVWAQVASIEDDTHLTLEAVYAGDGGPNGASSVCSYRYGYNDGAFSTDASQLVLEMNDHGAWIQVARFLGPARRKGCVPLRVRFALRFDVRYSSQVWVAGISDAYANGVLPDPRSVFLFSGGQANTVTAYTSSVDGASSEQTTLLTIPGGGDTYERHNYELRLYEKVVEFWIDDVLQTSHSVKFADNPYRQLYLYLMGLDSHACGAYVSQMFIDRISVESLASAEVVATVITPAPVRPQGINRSRLIPDPLSYGYRREDIALRLDPLGNLQTRGAVTNDEGAFSDDFSLDALPRNLNGTSRFQVNSALVVGTGTLYTTEVRVGDYVELDADFSAGIPAWVQVAEVYDDTHLRLVGLYGASGTGAASVSNYRYGYGAGGGLAVANSQATLTVGIVNGESIYLFRYLGAGGRKGTPPLKVQFVMDLSNRSANQDIDVGLSSIGVPGTTPPLFARFRFTGAVNTVVQPECASAAAAADSYLGTARTLPWAGTTAALHRFEIRLYADRVEWFIDDQRVDAYHYHTPYEYTPLYLYVIGTNSGVPGATNIVIDQIHCEPIDTVQVQSTIVAPLGTYSNPAQSVPMVVVNDAGPDDATIENEAIADNLVHSFDQVLLENVDYVMQVAGGEGICYCLATAAPGSIQTMPYLLSGQSRKLRTSLPGMILRVQKRVDGTADATAILVRDDGR